MSKVRIRHDSRGWWWIWVRGHSLGFEIIVGPTASIGDAFRAAADHRARWGQPN